MADENKRVIQYPEKNTVDNTDYVLIDSSPNGTNRYQVTRILTEAEAAAQTKVDAEAAAREAADDELKADLIALEQHGYPMASIQEAVNAWADEHEEEIVNAYITPEMYGAVGDGITDDTTAIQSAVNKGGFVLFATGKHYITNNVVRLVGNTIIDLNGSTLECTGKHMFFNFIGSSTATLYNGNGNIIIRNGILVGGATSFGHAKNVLLENLIFQNSHNDHFLEICACNNYVIRNCRFVGMEYATTSVMEYINIDPCSRTPFPWLDNASSPFYDGTVNDGITIDGCYFSVGSGDYAYGFNAIGVHASDGQKHKNIKITNNEIAGFTGCGMRINNMNGVLIDSNLVNVPASGANGIRVGDVSQSTNVIIKCNVIFASGTAITKANSSTVFQSADNVIVENYYDKHSWSLQNDSTLVIENGKQGEQGVIPTGYDGIQFGLVDNAARTTLLSTYGVAGTEIIRFDGTVMDGYYFIPIPEDSTSLNIELSPSTLYAYLSFVQCLDDETNIGHHFSRQQDSGWVQNGANVSFNHRDNQFISINFKANAEGTGSVDVSNVVITFNN